MRKYGRGVKMNMLCLYLRFILAAAVACLLFGFVLPALFSAPSSISVLLGISLILAIPVTVWLCKDVALKDIRTWIQLFPAKRLIMNKKKILISLPLLFLTLAVCAMSYGCSKVEAGYVGVKVNLLGGEKGVDSEVLGVGRYWIGWNEELYLFPTFQQTVAWQGTQGVSGAFQFQSREGLSLSADVSMSFTVNPDMVSTLFQKYRKGIDEITNLYLFNMVRDTMVQAASKRTAENLYGEGKNEFITEINALVRERMKPIGINIDYIAIIGNVWLPKNVKNAIDNKVKAGQLAAQRETEVATAKAEADKNVATAEGQARSKRAIADANAYALLTEARAQQEANRILSQSLTRELIQYNTVIRWNGQLPKITGPAIPMIQMP